MVILTIVLYHNPGIPVCWGNFSEKSGGNSCCLLVLTELLILTILLLWKGFRLEKMTTWHRIALQLLLLKTTSPLNVFKSPTELLLLDNQEHVLEEFDPFSLSRELLCLQILRWNGWSRMPKRNIKQPFIWWTLGFFLHYEWRNSIKVPEGCCRGEDERLVCAYENRQSTVPKIPSQLLTSQWLFFQVWGCLAFNGLPQMGSNALKHGG